MHAAFRLPDAFPPGLDGPVQPMLARPGALPAADDAHAYEFKWDGVRAIAHVTRDKTLLHTRNLTDVTARYPEVTALAGDCGDATLVLDGELVALDERGVPDFNRLQGRMHLDDARALRERLATTPVTYMVFDVLALDGAPLLGLPYEERRRVLDELALDGPAWRTPPAWAGGGEAVMAASRAMGLEGVIAKRLDSPYRPGARSGAWMKLKNIRGQEVVVGGWTPGTGSREGHLGALLVGVHDDEGRLRYAGKVGTGFSTADLARLADDLRPLARTTSPFDGGNPPRGARFVEPRLVAEVEFTEWTPDGRLRHPSYKGLRNDKPAADVRREGPG